MAVHDYEHNIVLSIFLKPLPHSLQAFGHGAVRLIAEKSVRSSFQKIDFVVIFAHAIIKILVRLCTGFESVLIAHNLGNHIRDICRVAFFQSAWRIVFREISHRAHVARFGKELQP